MILGLADTHLLLSSRNLTRTAGEEMDVRVHVCYVHSQHDVFRRGNINEISFHASSIREVHN